MRSLAKLKESIDSNLFVQLNQERFNIILDYQNFNNQCHEVNMLLDKHGYFLRVFELSMNLKISSLNIKKFQETKYC